MLEATRSAWRDFMLETTLCRRAGCASDALAMVAAKELVDNALDVSPLGIEVDVIENGLVVRDHGPGLIEPKILELFSVKRESMSSKRWRQARRGALGNGLRVVMGVMHVSRGSLIVESRGAALVIGIAPDGSARVVERFDSDVAEGTRITLRIGPGLRFDEDAITDYVEASLCGTGVAFGGSKAVPAWFDAPTVIELIRDVPPTTTALVFARQFDLTAEALDQVKARAARMTTLQLLDDEAELAAFVATIIAGGNVPRSLKRMGRGARAGAYAYEGGLHAARCCRGDAVRRRGLVSRLAGLQPQVRWQGRRRDRFRQQNAGADVAVDGRCRP